MKLAHIKHSLLEEHKDDLDRLEKVFLSYGILMSWSDLFIVWSLYSETKELEWIELLEKDEDIYLALVDYLTMEEW